MSAHRKQWNLKQPAAPELVQSLGQEPLLATLLSQRGISDPQVAASFLHDTYPDGLHNPLLMKGMPEASKRTARAIAEREPIAVYGDYDTDGVTAVTLLKHVVTTMGGTITPYIPHREREGYGLNHEAVEHIAAAGTRLLLTVDCGISNVEEVAHAQSLGMDVIVTDHHTPPAVLPQALAVVNPKQPGCTYPYQQLVGVGIAFKLAGALFKQGMRPIPRARDLLDLVALGTVADIGPLNGENRILVKAGLEALNMTRRPGLQALIKAAGIAPGQIDSQGIGFRLAPRLNAAGRIDDARNAYELLLTDDQEVASALAQELNEKNRQRQQITEEVQQHASLQAEALGKHQQRIVVIDGEGYPPGIVGLVAGRLVEVWKRPVVLLARGDELSTGSARSIPGFNIIQALTTCADLFERFGGHSMAAGLTIKTERLPQLEARLLDLANQTITDDMLVPTLDIDAEVPLEMITWDLFELLAQLEPCGEKNPQPVLMSRGVYATDVRAIGSQEHHLKFRLQTEGQPPVEAIAWRLGHLAAPLRDHPCIDIAYMVEAHEWDGRRSIQLNIKDFRRNCQDLN